MTNTPQPTTYVPPTSPSREQRLESALNFFASVIKSGEGWSLTCEKLFREAKAEAAR